MQGEGDQPPSNKDELSISSRETIRRVSNKKRRGPIYRPNIVETAGEKNSNLVSQERKRTNLNREQNRQRTAGRVPKCRYQYRNNFKVLQDRKKSRHKPDQVSTSSYPDDSNARGLKILKGTNEGNQSRIQVDVGPFLTYALQSVKLGLSEAFEESVERQYENFRRNIDTFNQCIKEIFVTGIQVFLNKQIIMLDSLVEDFSTTILSSVEDQLFEAFTELIQKQESQLLKIKQDELKTLSCPSHESQTRCGYLKPANKSHENLSSSTARTAEDKKNHTSTKSRVVLKNASNLSRVQNKSSKFSVTQRKSSKFPTDFENNRTPCAVKQSVCFPKANSEKKSQIFEKTIRNSKGLKGRRLKSKFTCRKSDHFDPREESMHSNSSNNSETITRNFRESQTEESNRKSKTITNNSVFKFKCPPLKFKNSPIRTGTKKNSVFQPIYHKNSIFQLNISDNSVFKFSNGTHYSSSKLSEGEIDVCKNVICKKKSKTPQCFLEGNNSSMRSSHKRNNCYNVAYNSDGGKKFKIKSSHENQNHSKNVCYSLCKKSRGNEEMYSSATLPRGRRCSAVYLCGKKRLLVRWSRLKKKPRGKNTLPNKSHHRKTTSVHRNSDQPDMFIGDQKMAKQGLENRTNNLVLTDGSQEKVGIGQKENGIESTMPDVHSFSPMDMSLAQGLEDVNELTRTIFEEVFILFVLTMEKTFQTGMRLLFSQAEVGLQLGVHEILDGQRENLEAHFQTYFSKQSIEFENIMANLNPLFMSVIKDV